MNWKKCFFLSCFIVVVGSIWYLQINGRLEGAVWRNYQQRHPVSFAAGFVAVYAVSVLATVPTLPMNLLAGALWGPFLGGILATASMSVAALLAFFAARYLFGQPLAGRYGNRFVSWLQNEFDLHGWRFLAFLRLNPVLPAGVLNYVLGLTSVSTPTFLWATLIFLLPPATAVAFLGSSMGTALEGSLTRSASTAATLLGVAVTLLVGIRYTAKYIGYKRTNDDDSARVNAE